jgi:hypothetical protein
MTVTLELSPEVEERAKVVARHTGRALETVLTEWLERGAELDVTNWLNPNTEYPLYTLYGNEATAHSLLEFLKAAEGDRIAGQDS